MSGILRMSPWSGNLSRQGVFGGGTKKRWTWEKNLTDLWEEAPALAKVGIVGGVGAVAAAGGALHMRRQREVEAGNKQNAQETIVFWEKEKQDATNDLDELTRRLGETHREDIVKNLRSIISKAYKNTEAEDEALEVAKDPVEKLKSVVIDLEDNKDKGRGFYRQTLTTLLKLLKGEEFEKEFGQDFATEIFQLKWAVNRQNAVYNIMPNKKKELEKRIKKAEKEIAAAGGGADANLNEKIRELKIATETLKSQEQQIQNEKEQLLKAKKEIKYEKNETNETMMRQLIEKIRTVRNLQDEVEQLKSRNAELTEAVSRAENTPESL